MVGHDDERVGHHTGEAKRNLFHRVVACFPAGVRITLPSTTVPNNGWRPWVQTVTNTAPAREESYPGYLMRFRRIRSSTIVDHSIAAPN